MTAEPGIESDPGKPWAKGASPPQVLGGNWQALIGAMVDVLDNPPEQESLRPAVREYNVELSASRYLEAPGLAGACADDPLD